jgi:hypothetical protein
MGHIKPSSIPFTSSILLVLKKDGTLRMCIDYWTLNKKTIKNQYPIPSIDELMDDMHGEFFFLKIDLWYGYHQINIKEKDIEKMTFWCHFGHFEFLVMPFRITNAPTTFQYCMNHIFRGKLRKTFLVFVNDILVYSKTWQEHMGNLEEVLVIQIWIHKLDGAQKGLKVNVIRMDSKCTCVYASSIQTQRNLNGIKRTSYSPNITFCSFFQTGKTMLIVQSIQCHVAANCRSRTTVQLTWQHKWKISYN